MLKERIVVGKAYVNERTRVLREVVEEVDGQRVKFNAFELGSGRLLPTRHRTCDKNEMASWAQREARPDEAARVHPFQPDIWTEPAASATARSMRLESVKAALELTTTPHTSPR